MEAKKGNASSPHKYHPFLIAGAEVGGWWMGEVEEKNEKSKSPLGELGFLLASIKGKVQSERQKSNKK